MRPLYGFGDHLGFDRHIVGHGSAHHPVHGACGEDAHELVFQREVEAAFAGVALTARAAPELVVYAAAFVAFRAEHIQTACLSHFFALGFAHRGEFFQKVGVAGVAVFGFRFQAFGYHFSACHDLGVAAEDDVYPSAGHVGGYCDRAELAGLGDDLGFSEVLLGVQNFVLDALTGEHGG